jgi:hypothetical protein
MITQSITPKPIRELLKGKSTKWKREILLTKAKQLLRQGRKMRIRYRDALVAQDYANGASYKELMQTHSLKEDHTEYVVRQQNKKFPGLHEKARKKRKARTRARWVEAAQDVLAGDKIEDVARRRNISRATIIRGLALRYASNKKLKKEVSKIRHDKIEKRNLRAIALFNRGVPASRILQMTGVSEKNLRVIISTTRKSNPEKVLGYKERLQAVKKWKARAGKRGIHYESSIWAEALRLAPERKFDSEKFLSRAREEVDEKTLFGKALLETAKLFLSNPKGMASTTAIKMNLTNKGFGGVEWGIEFRVLSLMMDMEMIRRFGKRGGFIITKEFDMQK